MNQSDFVTYHEIASQAETLRKILDRTSELPVKLSDYRSVILTGCGSSLYLSQIIAEVWTTTLGIPARAVPASEILLFPELYLRSEVPTAVFAFSRTGDTTETNRAARLIVDRFAFPVVAVTCYGDSKLGRLGQASLVFSEVEEKSVVMTRAFTGILGAFLKMSRPEENFDRIPFWIAESLERYDQPIASLAGTDFRPVAFLGTGIFRYVARECMLKVEEMTGRATKSGQTFEFRHGPKAILDDRALVWIFANRQDVPMLGEVIDEFRSLKATVALVGNRLPVELQNRANHSFGVDWPLKRTESEALGLLHLAQLFSFYRAVHLGKNPDRPDKLSRVVEL